MITDTRLAPAALRYLAAGALRFLVGAGATGAGIGAPAAAESQPIASPADHSAGSAAPLASTTGLILPTFAPPEYEPPPSEPPEYEPPPSEPPEYEPPPSEWPPPSPPPTTKPQAPPPPRMFFELGVAGTALVNRGVYGFGADLDLGARFRLPFGALGVSLRLGFEQHIQPEPAPLVMNLGVAITYLLARPRWRVGPYVGVWTQGMLQRIPDALGAIPLQRNEGGLTLGGLAGAQLRLWRGGIFTELGYRQTVYRQTQSVIPAWNAVQLLLGYRFTTN